jgi:hypothetical protein
LSEPTHSSVERHLHGLHGGQGAGDWLRNSGRAGHHHDGCLDAKGIGEARVGALIAASFARAPSSSSTRRPGWRRARAIAVARPVNPPPTIATSIRASPRSGGRSGSSRRPEVSNQ